MEILGFLFGLGCLVVIAGVMVILGGLVFGRKRRRPDQRHEQPSPQPTQFREHNSSQSTITEPSTPIIPRRQVIALRQPVSSRVRLPSNRHQQYIRLAERVLKRLRSGEVQLPKAIAILRKMNPYAFEELLLTCCQSQGWKIERNFRYTRDGGIDGRVTIAGRLYLIQAKRYRGYINLKHIRDFNQVIQQEKAYGGFFIHSGKTGELAKKLLREYQISLLSGQRLVDFVLGQKLRILG